MDILVISNIIKWLNENNGCLMVILTLVYVVATILICLFNYRAAETSKEQTREVYRQFIENTRAHIIPKFKEIEGQIICLVFENIGKDIATDVVIDINEEWLKKLGQTKAFPENANNLRNLKDGKLFFTINQTMYYGLWVPGDGSNDFEILGEKELLISIKYKSLGKEYKEDFAIALKNYNYMVNPSDYVRLTKKQNDKIDSINESLKKLINHYKD